MRAVMKVLSCSRILKGGLVNFSEQNTADTLTQELAARCDDRQQAMSTKEIPIVITLSVWECTVNA